MIHTEAEFIALPADEQSAAIADRWEMEDDRADAVAIMFEALLAGTDEPPSARAALEALLTEQTLRTAPGRLLFAADMSEMALLAGPSRDAAELADRLSRFVAGCEPLIERINRGGVNEVHDVVDLAIDTDGAASVDTSCPHMVAETLGLPNIGAGFVSRDALLDLLDESGEGESVMVH